MPLSNKSHLLSSLESLRVASTLLLFVLLTVLSGCSDSGHGEGTLDKEVKDHYKPISVSPGYLHTCAVLKSGLVKCWGHGSYGQLGNKSAQSTQMTPITVSNISNATALSAGEFHNCVLLSDGRVKCWGQGGYGQLGNGSTDNQTTPVTVSGITSATTVSNGANHSCALLSEGIIKCWGLGDYGRLGNGYAITAIVGKKSIMENSQKSFISSTFWTERIGPTAALKTIEIMKEKRTWTTITSIGEKIQARWKELAEFSNLKIKVYGIPSLANFVFLGDNNQSYKTLITQEMLKNNFLASNSVYCCIKHNNIILDKYFDKLKNVFKMIKSCEEGSDITKYLKSKISVKDFRRLN